MAHLKGKEALLAWFDAHTEDATEPKPYWTIYASKEQNSNGKGACWLRSSEQPNLSFKESKIALERAIDKMMTGGTSYYIVLKAKEDSTSKQAITIYTHQSEGAAISGIGSSADIETRIAEGIARYEERKDREALQTRIAELETANKALENEATPEWMNKIGTVISGLIENPAVVNGIMGTGTTKPSKQMGAVKTQEQQSADQTRLENSLEALSKIDPDFVTSLEKLAKLAAENPNKYNMAKSML
jgi:hypothetical protein